jgi:hypothetical protein
VPTWFIIPDEVAKLLASGAIVPEAKREIVRPLPGNSGG